jgi:hypothetical protein
MLSDKTNSNAAHISEIESGIINYEENVNRGNLLTFDTKAFYNSALAGNVQSFEELKILLEEAIEERIASDKMMKKNNLKSFCRHYQTDNVSGL